MSKKHTNTRTSDTDIFFTMLVWLWGGQKLRGHHGGEKAGRKAFLDALVLDAALSPVHLWEAVTHAQQDRRKCFTSKTKVKIPFQTRWVASISPPWTAWSIILKASELHRNWKKMLDLNLRPLWANTFMTCCTKVSFPRNEHQQCPVGTTAYAAPQRQLMIPSWLWL